MAIGIGLLGQGGDPGTSNQFVTATLTGTTVAGRCIVAFVVLSDNTKSVSSFNDDSSGGPMSWTFVGAVNVTGLRIECWRTGVAGVLGGASFINALFSGLTPGAIALVEYSGVAAIGGNSSTNNTNANPTISRTTVDNDNYIVGGFGSVGSTIPTAGTGTLRRSVNSTGASPVVASLVDNTNATPASVTDAMTLAATTWAAIALELRTGGGGAGSGRGGLTLMGVG